MSSLTLTPRREDPGFRSLLTATRGQAPLVVALVGAAGLCWWWTSERMAGMYTGPSTELGSLGWFTGVWAVMMAAMMLPSLAPTAALYASGRAPGAVPYASRRKTAQTLMFVAGYLLVWAAAGVGAWAALGLGRHLLGGQLAWSSGGRWLAGGVLVLAGAYELTPLKSSCLGRCRSPLADLRGAASDGPVEAIRTGARIGGVCLGCCAGLMAALFALGVMSLTWMVVVAALIGVQKLAPWRQAAVVATVAVVLALGIALLVSPAAVPGLTVPGHGPAMHQMSMGMSGAGMPAGR